MPLPLAAAAEADHSGAVVAFAVILTSAAAAALFSLALARILRLDALLRLPLAPRRTDPQCVIRQLRLLADAAHQSGLASLAPVADRINDRFLAHAVRLAAAGTEPGELRTALERRMDAALAAQARRARLGAILSRSAALIAPITIGIAVTLMLRYRADPLTISPPVGAALLCVVLLALALTSLHLPSAPNIPGAAADQTFARTLVTAGILAIRAGDSPETVESRLRALLPASTPPAQPERLAA